MSALEDLIREISDENLRRRIQSEVANLKQTKKFGLVFENQNPECVPLFNVPVKKNSLVALKAHKLNETYRVISCDDHKISCLRDNKIFYFDLNELVCVAQFGDPIYPGLQLVDTVCNAPDSSLWHALIEADNYHALQLLKYCCAGKVDCIYIDPPYNTGARDWKYNNEYVDSNDSYRHSKWLSMMQKRLLLAKDILSDSGAIFISIDDNEQAVLKLLCDEIFGYKNFVAKFCVKRSGGRQDSKFFAVVSEFLFCYAKNSNSFIAGEDINKNIKFPKFDESNGKKYKTQLLRKWGSNSRRIDRPNLFYSIPAPDGSELFPMLTENEEGSWRWGKNKMQSALENNLIEFVKKDGVWVAYEKIYQSEETEIRKKFTTWIDENFSEGADIIKNIFGDNVFSYPKSVELIKKILQMGTNKNSLIVDFFAGSGTTLHAVNLLNAQDGGKRRCILVTNNEVSDVEEKNLRRAGYTPADEEWQKFGIARHVTWTRTVCSIKGQDINGAPLKGQYSDETAMSDGFKSNAAYFKLGFLDKDFVALGRQFKEILPVIWFKSGCRGKCPTWTDEKNLPSMLILRENNLAILLDEKFFGEFERKVRELPNIDTLFFVTDSEYGYHAMIKNFSDKTTYRLYQNYLENFKISG